MMRNCIRVMQSFIHRTQFEFVLIKAKIQFNSPQKQKGLDFILKTYEGMTTTPVKINLLTQTNPREKIVEVIATKQMKNFYQRFSGTDMKYEAIKMMREGLNNNSMKLQIDILLYDEKLTLTKQKYLIKILGFWGNLLVKVHQSISDRKSQDYKKMVKFATTYIEDFNSLLFLISPNKEIVQTFFSVLMIKRKLYTQNQTNEVFRQNYYAQFKLIFNVVMMETNKKQWKKRDILSMLRFINKFPLSTFYYEKQNQINDFIFDSLKHHWQNIRQEDIETKTMIFNVCLNIFKNHNIPDYVLDSLDKLLCRDYSVQVKVVLFQAMIHSFQITKQNINQPKYLNIVKKIINTNPRHSFIYLFLAFYKAHIWIEQFWLPFFQFLQRSQNKFQIQSLQLFIINDLLTLNEDIIPKKVIQAGKFTFNYLKTLNNIPDSINIKKQFSNLFGPLNENKNSFQTYVTRTFQLINKSLVESEMPVKYFVVDIFINKKIVIEINNIGHYKIIKGEKRRSLQSEFKKYVLEKAGYIFFEIKVEEYLESNYSMHEEINDIVDQSKKYI